ncbi:guanylate kinase [Nitrosomonas mobilis]|uniref:Guanylate kinase n=1 Tax=Nitrosomonas mobilis TaxID=51642 RepID=A0A1G5SHC3_9PROT|nr:guanylate kinase [Nitrosomonas mobilis]SCZ85951.1 guanylate kinase [Nitrosomonas mobilis]HNO75604.1 guanylate kinase [Nitrosomonas mobilis]
MSFLIVISAPSGTGKTSVVSSLLQVDPNINLSVSHTTRPPRQNEVDGHDYFFVDRARFQEMLKQREFLESAEVYGNFYGTSRSWIEEKMAAGKDVLLEIDCQGALQVRELYPQALSIFILPPSLEILKQRLEQRGMDENKVIERRLSAAREEVSHVHKYDYLIVNQDLQETVQQIACIVRAERLKTIRQLAGQRELIAQFA